MPVFGRVGRHVAACAPIAGRLLPVPLAGAEAHQRAVFGDPLLGADGGGALSTIVRRKPEHTRLFRFVVYNPINIF